ncbi:hypothetical protein PROFUN_07760 [Planoprotostelium fungivorum]|uniref:NmrA-like domain-containing protein n=1 Tax=Planoprotostelium fungivorum TaxID=1890364 RepID=A0A2P6N1H1_9EUKA|nr:hypothetical protein PROFUN_07760 [Planoprotostelium fungivorum]
MCSFARLPRLPWQSKFLYLNCVRPQHRRAESLDMRVRKSPIRYVDGGLHIPKSPFNIRCRIVINHPTKHGKANRNHRSHQCSGRFCGPHFAQLPDWRVRGITRNPSSPAAKKLEEIGVEIVQADADDKHSLIDAFTSWQYALRRETEQAINIAEAAETPSILKTLERFVFSSIVSVTKWSKGKYTQAYHQEGKEESVRQIRERCPGVSAVMSFVYLGTYVNNWRFAAVMGPQRQPDGSFIMTRNTPAHLKLPHVVAERDTGPYVRALVDMEPGKKVFAVSEYMSFTDFMELWGQHHRVKASYREISTAEMVKDMPEVMATDLGQAYDFYHEFGFTGGDPEVLEREQIPVKVEVTSMADYIKSEDWSQIINAK